MGFKKCPKCDLNYIRDDEKLCKVCMRSYSESVDDQDDAIVYCIECGDRPAVAGLELCSQCRKDKQKIQMLSSGEIASHQIDSIVLSDVEIDDLEIPLDDALPDGEIDEEDLFDDDSDDSDDSDDDN